jgi:hypothetical protein
MSTPQSPSFSQLGAISAMRNRISGRTERGRHRAGIRWEAVWERRPRGQRDQGRWSEGFKGSGTLHQGVDTGQQVVGQQGFEAEEDLEIGVLGLRLFQTADDQDGEVGVVLT